MAQLATDLLMRIASDQEFSALFLKGQVAIDELDEEETFRFDTILYTIFESWETAFSQRQRGALAEEDWKKWDAVIGMHMADPGSQAFWKKAASNFSQSFQDHISSVTPSSTYDFGRPKLRARR